MPGCKTTAAVSCGNYCCIDPSATIGLAFGTQISFAFLRVDGSEMITSDVITALVDSP
jgi:hypothetical protein